jgi:hypothetical protein
MSCVLLVVWTTSAASLRVLWNCFRRRKAEFRTVLNAAYFVTGVLLRTGTNETGFRKQTDVADWWNWMYRILMCGPLRVLSKRGTASFYILVRNSNVMSERSTRSQPVFKHFRVPAKRLLKKLSSSVRLSIHIQVTRESLKGSSWNLVYDHFTVHGLSISITI